MAREELAAWLRLLLTPGVGNETARKLLAAFGLPQAVFAQSLAALQTVVGARIASAGGNRTAAARLLGISRASLYDRLGSADMASDFQTIV
mgnify:CR=1 FL=1